MVYLPVAPLLTIWAVSSGAPVFDAAHEATVRRSVYGHKAWIETPEQEIGGMRFQIPPGELVVPHQLAELYKKHPRAVLDVLLRIMDGGSPKDSSLAAGYAVSLLDGPAVGVVCVEFFDEATYDTVKKHWKVTPRQHWIRKVREKMTDIERKLQQAKK